MSNALAIATVTGVIAARVRALLTEAGFDGFEIRLTHPTDAEELAVYVHLYQVLASPGLRNETLPERESNGQVRVPPRLALDLFYLLTFVGNNDNFDSERLAGVVMTGLHSIPTIGPSEINDFVAALGAGHVLLETDLANQVERVRLTPITTDIEDLSRLWGMFGQSFHRLSVMYRASTVLLDPAVTAGPALPVVTPALTTFVLRQPEITAVRSSARPLSVVQFGEQLVVRGHSLRGHRTFLRVGSRLIPVSDATDEGIAVPFNAPANLAAGMVPVQVVHRVELPDMGTREAAASNTVPVALVPAVTMNQPNAIAVTVDGQPMHEVWLDVDPTPAESQDVELLVTGTADEGRHSSTDWRVDVDTGAVVFTLRPLPAGSHLVRLSVDRAVSLLVNDQVTGLFVEPSVVVT